MNHPESNLPPLDMRPDPARAAALDRRMRQRLIDSLNYIRGQAGNHLTFPDREFEKLLERLRDRPVSAAVFAAYYDLVLSIGRDALGDAQHCLDELIAASADSVSGPAIVALKDFTEDRISERYRRFVDTDPNLPFVIVPPSAEKVEACRRRIETAFGMLDRATPDLSNEIRALIRQIVLAVGPDEPGATVFDGASSFMLWGAVVLNADSYQNDLDMVQVLAHESGHNLLFGLCADGPLIENDDAERYSSPVRRDPRPMDGIVHAAFVIARMHQSLRGLIDAGILDETQRAEAATALDTHQRSFATAIDTVDKHGLLTPLGHSVMEGARAYMKAQA
ncbi:MAG: HEXXH motif-containing putative peptide modification protein [Rhodospirillaceae bacterium]|nr:HEXXH motif-containing putative peptide modification protein [Rhodospirillaceae bacterium]